MLNKQIMTVQSQITDNGHDSCNNSTYDYEYSLKFLLFELASEASANGHCTAFQDSDRRAYWTAVFKNQNFILNFMFLNAWK